MICIKYFVYRFLDKTGNILYVGKTVNLTRRILSHEHLNDEVKSIEYLECKSEADMGWKEVYYINLFRNERMTNITDVFNGEITNLGLQEDWKPFVKTTRKYTISKERVKTNSDLINNVQLRKNSNLIHIIEKHKINFLDKDKFAFSRKWFYDNELDGNIKTLSNHVTNYFRNICRAKTNQCMWTVYDEFKNIITGKGFRKGYTSLNSDRVMSDRIYLAYLCNNFYPTKDRYKDINEDGFALSEMLQFIWRSAIRDGKEIWIYIPSIRMRKLLKTWIDENSLENI